MESALGMTELITICCCSQCMDAVLTSYSKYIVHPLGYTEPTYIKLCSQNFPDHLNELLLWLAHICVPDVRCNFHSPFQLNPQSVCGKKSDPVIRWNWKILVLTGTDSNGQMEHFAAWAFILTSKLSTRESSNRYSKLCSGGSATKQHFLL